LAWPTVGDGQRSMVFEPIAGLVGEEVSDG
jgi:hypothetical protein